jgi:uncharacterized protein (DUF305 family)
MAFRKIPNVVWVAAALVLGALAALGIYALAGPPSEERDETSGTIVQPGAPGEPSRELTEEELADIEAPPHTEADVEFMQGMIHHHGQALEMTALVDDRSDSADITLFAERIERSQEAEIDLLEDWLAGRDETVPEVSGGPGAAPGDHGGDEAGEHEVAAMPGMLSGAQFAQLRAATGPEFDRLFLEFMIQHHRGALVMVSELFSAGGGLEPESNAVAAGIEADQEIEIARMEDLLARLATQPT